MVMELLQLNIGEAEATTRETLEDTIEEEEEGD